MRQNPRLPFSGSGGADETQNLPCEPPAEQEISGIFVQQDDEPEFNLAGGFRGRILTLLR